MATSYIAPNHCADRGVSARVVQANGHPFIIDLLPEGGFECIDHRGPVLGAQIAGRIRDNRSIILLRCAPDGHDGTPLRGEECFLALLFPLGKVQFNGPESKDPEESVPCVQVVACKEPDQHDPD